ncbi:MAG: hypothetical protein GC190_17890 [Alphaproteobacteria bacterium]|nr:hypothetical protein [Alphaproteobacteria bacterium]
MLRCPDANAGNRHDEHILSVDVSEDGVLVLGLKEFAADATTVKGVVAALAGTPAGATLVFDLRGNRGGDAQLFRIVAGCLLNTVEPLFTIAWRDGEGVRSVTALSMPVEACQHHRKSPVYILVDHATASTAELMPFILQARGRAIVVGEKTYGASHAAEMFRLRKGLGLMLPIGRTYDPLTGRDWEGVGVSPDIAVPSAAAREVALRQALCAQHPSAPRRCCCDLAH